MEQQLTKRQLAILSFERKWWNQASVKEQAIRDELGYFPVRYYQLLNQLLDNPAALAADPSTVKRLRRIRESRARTRAA